MTSTTKFAEQRRIADEKFEAFKTEAERDEIMSTPFTAADAVDAADAEGKLAVKKSSKKNYRLNPNFDEDDDVVRFNTLNIVIENDVLKIDGIFLCQKPETAYKRFRKIMAQAAADIPALEGWDDFPPANKLIKTEFGWKNENGDQIFGEPYTDYNLCLDINEDSMYIWGVFYLTDEAYYAAHPEEYVNPFAEETVDAKAEEAREEIMSTPLVTEEAFDAAIEAEIELATTTEETVELPVGEITVSSGAEAWAIVGKYFPNGLNFCGSSKGFNYEDTFSFTADNTIFVKATCTPDNSRVEAIEVINTNESGSKRHVLNVYIKHDETEEISDGELLKAHKEYFNHLGGDWKPVYCDYDKTPETDGSEDDIDADGISNLLPDVSSLNDVEAENTVESKPEVTISAAPTAEELYKMFAKTIVNANVMNVTLQNGRKMWETRFEGAYVTPEYYFKHWFIKDNLGFLFARYDTPEQVETVITMLKNVIDRGEKEFTFPTVEQLNALSERKAIDARMKKIFIERGEFYDALGEAAVKYALLPNQKDSIIIGNGTSSCNFHRHSIGNAFNDLEKAVINFSRRQ